MVLQGHQEAHAIHHVPDQTSILIVNHIDSLEQTRPVGQFVHEVEGGSLMGKGDNAPSPRASGSHDRKKGLNLFRLDIDRDHFRVHALLSKVTVEKVGRLHLPDRAANHGMDLSALLCFNQIEKNLLRYLLIRLVSTYPSLPFFH